MGLFGKDDDMDEDEMSSRARAEADNFQVATKKSLDTKKTTEHADGRSATHWRSHGTSQHESSIHDVSGPVPTSIGHGTSSSAPEVNETMDGVGVDRSAKRNAAESEKRTKSRKVSESETFSVKVRIQREGVDFASRYIVFRQGVFLAPRLW